MFSRIAIDDLKPGMVIVQITQQNGPVKIRKSGLVTSEAMVQGLAEMGVQEVEIDQEQTVEIAPNKTHTKTQTQALLRGQHDTTAQLDKTLSDQFNRSLFLPTVQSLPSVWKVYGKEALVYAVLIAGGLSIGYTTATRDQWLVAFNPAPAPIVVQQVVPFPSSQTPIATQNQQEAPPLPNSIESTSVGSEPEQETLVTTNAPVVPSLSIEDEEEGIVINNADSGDNVQVSPDLLARFNAAVAALESAPSTDVEPQVDPVAVRNELPRVDQLPVRLMTRLPDMNFSAHMYASRPSDRWVRVNGLQAVEGDWIDGRVQIVNIEAQKVVLSIEDTLFTMAALTDW